MTRPWNLDLDTLRLILEYVENDKTLLLRMSLLNGAVHSLTLPILYRSNSFKRVETAYKFCQALHNHPHALGRFVKKLHLHNTYGAAKILWSQAATKFVPLIRKTLPLLPNLRDLLLSGVEFEPNTDPPLPFSLQSFSLSLPVEIPPWDFLRNQASLTQLELRSHSSRIRLGKDDCLSSEDIPYQVLFPELNTLSACSEIYAILGPGRPITHVRISGCQTHRDTVHMPRILTAIGLSAKPIQTLRIDLGSLRRTSCVEFVDHLRSINTLSDLKKLTLITTDVDNEYWRSSVPADQQPPTYPPSPPELFSQLGALRHLTIEKPTWQPSIVFDPELNVHRFQPEPVFKSVWNQAEAAELWGTRCPRLVSVRIYGRKLRLPATPAPRV